MIVLSRDEDARIAVEKLIDAGAMDLKNNEKFILYKSHLEALELLVLPFLPTQDSGPWLLIFSEQTRKV